MYVCSRLCPFLLLCYYCIARRALFVGLRMECTATSSAGTSIVVLRARKLREKGFGLAHEERDFASRRRDDAPLLHPTLRWESDFLLFGPEIGSRGSDPPPPRSRLGERLIEDTRVWFSWSASRELFPAKIIYRQICQERNISVHLREESSDSNKNF